MTDPFQDVEAGGPEFVNVVVSALENRAAEDQMIPVIEAYLDDIDWPDDGLHVEVATGSGAIARRMAARSDSGQTVGFDPSPGLIEKALELANEQPNLRLEVGDGSALRFESATVNNVVMHTVLSHVAEPSVLLGEAMRVLKPGGYLVVCDADFEKMAIGNDRGDPLQASAEYFVENFVSQPYLTAQIRRLATASGFDVQDFRLSSRTITDGDGGLVWIGMSSRCLIWHARLSGIDSARVLWNVPAGNQEIRFSIKTDSRVRLCSVFNNVALP